MEIAAFGMLVFFAVCLFILATQRDRVARRYDMVISILNGCCNADAAAKDVREIILRARRSGLLP